MNTGVSGPRVGWFRVLMVLLAMTWGVSGWAQTLDVPQPWIDYAQLAGSQFQASLEADDDAANRLHRLLEDRILNAKVDAPPLAIVVRAWIGMDGSVTKVEFDPLGDAQADAILRQLLTARRISEPPPPDMRQPLRVRLQMVANPDAALGASAAGSK
jgi:hypothetical protein